MYLYLVMGGYTYRNKLLQNLYISNKSYLWQILTVCYWVWIDKIVDKVSE